MLLDVAVRRGAGMSHEIDLHAARRQRERLVLHARAASDVAKHDHGGSHGDEEEKRTIAARVALVVGPTPGHVYPALAVADAIRAERASADIVVIGPDGSDAMRLIDEGRYRVETIPASPLARAGAAARGRAVAQVGTGFVAARRLLTRERTQMVIGCGSYASGAVVLAARSLGLLTAVHEANVVPGLANRLLGRVVDRVYLSVQTPRAWWYASARARVVGTPVRGAIDALAEGPRTFPTGRAMRALVLGGHWGADFLAREAPPLLGRLARHGLALDAWHQHGSEPPEAIARAYDEAGIAVRLMPYIEDMAAAYGWADFVVGRSGAGLTSELALMGLPALLIPWADAADDHQAANARAFAGAGAGLWASERAWSSGLLADRLTILLRNAEMWEAASAAAWSLARPGAATLVARDVLSLIGGRS